MVVSVVVVAVMVAVVVAVIVAVVVVVMVKDQPWKFAEKSSRKLVTR